MNIEQLMESRDRVKKIMGTDEDLVDFVKVVDFILTKPYKHVCHGIKEIDFSELEDDIKQMENVTPDDTREKSIQRFAGWADTLDIVTNPEEMKMIKKFN